MNPAANRLWEQLSTVLEKLPSEQDKKDICASIMEVENISENIRLINTNFALVARTFLRSPGGDQQSVPRVLHLVCGGCTAAGTAAAGAFLKHEWQRQLLKFYEDERKSLKRDSLVVVLRFTGEKAESSKPEIVQACFFHPSQPAVFYRLNEKNRLAKEGVKPYPS